jgi:TRAP-type C4-dicarboxylate transport system permease large subunit
MSSALILQSTAIGSPLLGIIIPGVVLVISFVVTWLLYRHFSKH